MHWGTWHERALQHRPEARQLEDISGETTIHIDPMGLVRRCPDFPADRHWSESDGNAPINCNACYSACPVDAQVPLTLSRFQDLLA
jgi:ferredoxin